MASLPIIDLSSPDRIATASSIRRACIERGFFYLVNHGLEQESFTTTLQTSRDFFSLPLHQKMKLSRKVHRGYTPLYAENSSLTSATMGDSKEGFYVGPVRGTAEVTCLNQWPPQEVLPSWRATIESYYEKTLSVAKTLASFIALALNLEEDYFEKIGALDKPNCFLRLLHYPGELGPSGEDIHGALPHTDFGMMTLLASDGAPGLQICRDKTKQPQVWEDVKHIDGAFVVNIGDMLERWTNCLFRSTLHRVRVSGQERYSLAFFSDPNPDCIVKCVETCCSESSPPRFPAIRSGDYLEERLTRLYGS